MKKNLKLIVFTVVLCAVSALNVKVVLDTEHSGDLAMTSLAAIGEGGSGEGGSGEDGKFPSDPFPDSGRNANRKVTSNYYEYTYQYLYKIEMDYYYQEYRIPVTDIRCPGMGEVLCHETVVFGVMEQQGIVCFSH